MCFNVSHGSLGGVIVAEKASSLSPHVTVLISTIFPCVFLACLPPDHEFTQLIKGYQGERLRQAFHFFDQDGDGYINPDEFQRIIMVRSIYRNLVKSEKAELTWEVRI